MRNVDEQIKISDKAICGLIDKFGADERGFLSQSILDKLRTFVEAISVKAIGETDYSYDIFKDKAQNHIAAKADLRFLSKFHKFLQHSKSHYATDEEASERLMLKYYEYLLRVKLFLKLTYNFDVLKNIDKFPINTDQTLNEYYEKISFKIKEPYQKRARSNYKESFYVQKVKPFFVNQEVFYEITFRIADDKLRKFDRLIAFTKLEIIENYAVKFFISNDYIEISNKKMPIQIIDNWKVSIRPCEFKNYENIFTSNSKDYSRTNEYDEIMTFLTKTGLNLVEIIDFPDNYYDRFKNRITQKTSATRILDLLDKSREFVCKGLPGTIMLRYLLYSLNNRIIKEQYGGGNFKLSNLNLLYECIPFDEMPFASCPVKHTPILSSLLDCIDVTGREHELFARRISSNAETRGWLYTPLEDVKQFENINGLIDKFNNSLYQGTETQRNRKLEMYKNHIYITGYENAVVEIVKKLKELSVLGIKNYSNSINAWLSSTDAMDVDCPQKKDALRAMFIKSKVSLIYGAAGTGKTKLIEYISKYHNQGAKLCLANTHSAISNLQSRIKAQNTEFKTIKSFLSGKNQNTVFDILIIDECSVVSNADMRSILERASFGALILVGDIFQIESIRFGNWFYIAKSFVPESSVIELTIPWRAKNNSELLELWSKVRNIEKDLIIEHITKNKYSSRLDNSIFEHSENDEIILCLNYDGFYGINNINRFLQESNKNNPISWGVHTYKVDDPILFNESNRFGSVIHNNLKGKILNIQTFEKRIQFDIQIDKPISELDIRSYNNIELLDSSEVARSVIRFSVNEIRNTDEDDDDSASDIVPFQVAYAVSIHKAQGLEYDSVKVVITNEIEERISHNIFYTAITRTKKKLKIYWTPETEKKILDKLEKKFNKKDASLLKEKYKFN